MRKIFLFIFIIQSIVSFSQKEKVQLYVDIYKDIAMQEMQRTGVPAAITLAQGILESKFGESELSTKANNHFGIKCKLDWNGATMYQDDDTKNECFRKYNTATESYIDHSNFLKSRSHYAWLFNLDNTDYKAWAKGLKKSGYATESDYAERLIGLIETYNLNQYSIQTIKKAEKLNTNVIKDVSIHSKVNISEPIVVATIVKDDSDLVEPKQTRNNFIKEKAKYPNTIFSINGTKVIYAKAGTSTLALANNYNLELSKLFDINDMDEIEILDTDKLIFLELKQRRGIMEYHTVLANESLHDIAQMEGVRLDMIAEYNGISKKLNPLIGEKIYLRNKAPKSPKMSTAIATSQIQIQEQIIN